MSLSRSEEMHRLTENVYKVSFQRGSESPLGVQARAGHGLPGCGCGGPIFGWSQVAAPAQGPRPAPSRSPSPSASGRPHPDGAAQPPRARSLGTPVCPGVRRDRDVRGLGGCASWLGPLHPAASRSEGNEERGRRGGCRLPRAVALRLLGGVAPWGSSRRCYASLWALSPQQALPFLQLLYEC